MLNCYYIYKRGGLMLNYLWTVMLVIGIIVGAATGNMQNISNAVVTSAQEAVELCITMLGIMVMWTGVMKIAQRAGLLDRLHIYSGLSSIFCFQICRRITRQGNIFLPTVWLIFSGWDGRQLLRGLRR